MSVIRDSGGYCLRLANGQSWRLIAADGTGPVVDRMAEILRLRACDQDDGTKMIFTRGDHDSQAKPEFNRSTYPELSDYPADGWSMTGLGYIRIWTHERVPDIVCEVIDRDIRRGFDYNDLSFTDIWRVIYSLYPIYNKAFNAGGTTMHAAMFELNGKGALIAAKSGTGKSTCYRRIEAPWRAVSDEEALIVRAGDRYLMHPMPTWSDFIEKGLNNPRDMQRYIPLSGIFFLEQAPVDEAVPLGKGDAAMRIFNSSEQLNFKYLASLKGDKKAVLSKRLLDNAIELSRRVPSYALKATLTGRFWDEMEKVLV